MFAIPEDLIKENIQDYVSNHGKFNTELSIRGLKKGVFFKVSADTLELKKDDISALRITEVSCRINPLYLLKKELAFSVRGRIGTGNIQGYLRLPESGTLKIDNAEINAIPYFNSLGLKINGLFSAKINLEQNTLNVIFKTSEVDIKDSVFGILQPLKSIYSIQGALKIQGSVINVKSVSLEGEKGYARIKGDITNGSMNLVLELMPYGDKLKPIESMLLSKYQISPGYYVIPIKGPLL
jgi:type II secretion system protein N